MTILTDIIPSVGLAQRTTIGHAIQHVAAGTGANMFNFFYCLSCVPRDVINNVVNKTMNIFPAALL
jgi:hypothetical protein